MALAALFYFLKEEKGVRILKIGDKYLNIEIADSEKEREQGLSGRDYLGDDAGLLFIFERDDFYHIWMKDVRFAIDVIWIDKDGKVVDIENNVSPATFPNSFTSDKPARYVLEVNAGWAGKNAIKIGDLVSF